MAGNGVGIWRVLAPLLGYYFVGLLAFLVLVIAGFWKTFEKAGRPGWASIVPVYNIYVLVKVAGRPGWWLILLFLPFVNIVASAIVCVDVARNFGKGTVFGVGLWLFPFVLFPVLGFGDATYNASIEG